MHAYPGAYQVYWQVPFWWPLRFVSSHAQTPPSDKEASIWDFFHFFHFIVPWFSCLHNVTCIVIHFHGVIYKLKQSNTFTHMHTHAHAHTLPHKGSFNDVQAHLRQFHLEVEQRRRVIPIDLETPTSLQKRYKTSHRGAYVHQAGGTQWCGGKDKLIVIVVDTKI